jgi:hypothetical protein
LKEKDDGGVAHPTSGVLKKDGRQGNPAAQPLGFFRQVTAAKSTISHFLEIYLLHGDCAPS